MSAQYTPVRTPTSTLPEAMLPEATLPEATVPEAPPPAPTGGRQRRPHLSGTSSRRGLIPGRPSRLTLSIAASAVLAAAAAASVVALWPAPAPAGTSAASASQAGLAQQNRSPAVSANAAANAAAGGATVAARPPFVPQHGPVRGLMATSATGLQTAGYIVARPVVHKPKPPAARKPAATHVVTAAPRTVVAPKVVSAPAASAPVSPGSARAIAQAMLASYGWSSSQFACLDPLWARESGWNVHAANPDGAYGIPQALPGSKMASAGADWQSSATTQIRWGLSYIKSRYGSPCAAWSHEQADGWY